MSANVAHFINEAHEALSGDLRSLATDVRNRLVVSFVFIESRSVPLSFYGDDVWELSVAPTNREKSKRQLDFRTIPEPFRETTKAITWRYMRRGREAGKIPSAGTLKFWIRDCGTFLSWLSRIGVTRLADASPIACLQFVEAEKERISQYGKPLGSGALHLEFRAIETLFELSQYTEDPMPTYPWPDSSARHLSKSIQLGPYVSRTPLIPDDVFCMLFQAAWMLVQKGESWLDIRDELEGIEAQHNQLSRRAIEQRKRRLLCESGWLEGLDGFTLQITELRTACYIVVASLSGCRNHELAYIQSEPYYSTEDDDGETNWWMKSRSDKTSEGDTEWLIPPAAVRALRLMERWAKPYQANIDAEIKLRQQANPNDPEIADAMKSRLALFLGVSLTKRKLVRTLSDKSWIRDLKRFTKKLGLTWNLTTHQFRRKFANYSARSQFGDLRYLKEHYKHWSLDMTLAYALNDHQEMALFLEIETELEDLKVGIVEQWLSDDAKLAGGFGHNIVEWRGTHPVTIFKNHATMVRSLAESISLRSALHGWCAADEGGCVGLRMDSLRCTDCDNAIIAPQHAYIYQRQYQELQSLLNLHDIGEAGLNRVRAGMEKCRSVLEKLGVVLDATEHTNAERAT